MAGSERSLRSDARAANKTFSQTFALPEPTFERWPRGVRAQAPLLLYTASVRGHRLPVSNSSCFKVWCSQRKRKVGFACATLTPPPADPWRRFPNLRAKKCGDSTSRRRAAAAKMPA